jgi:hypothetical protein
MDNPTISSELFEDISKRFSGPFVVPLENKNYVPSFRILSWQCESCGHNLIPNTNQLEDSDEPGLPF